MFLKLQIFNTEVYLEPSVKIRIYRRNSMIERKDDNSLPFDIPSNEVNNKIFGFFTRPASVNRKYEYPAKLFFKNRLLIDGTLIVQKGSNNYYSAYLKAGKNLFNGLVSGVYMNECPYFNVDDLIYYGESQPIFNIQGTLIPGNGNYVSFPMLVRRGDSTALINRFEAHMGRFYLPGLDVSYSSAFYPFMKHVLRKMFLLLGYTLNENIFDTDTDLSKLVQVHNYFFSEVANPLYSYYKLNIKFWNVLPHVLISDFLNAIQLLFACTIFIDDVFKTVDIVKNSDILNKMEVVSFSAISEDYEVEEYVDDGYLIEYSGSISEFSQYETLDNKSMLPDPEIANIDKVYLVKNENCYYQLIEQGSELTYEFKGAALHKRQIGEGGRTFGIDVNPVKLTTTHELFTYVTDDTGTSTAHRSQVFPIMDEVNMYPLAISEDYTFSAPPNNDMPLRITFYRGMVQMIVYELEFFTNFWPQAIAYGDWSRKTDQEKRILRDVYTRYPLANYTVYSCFGAKLANANISLKVDDPDYGLFVKFWKYFAENFIYKSKILLRQKVFFNLKELLNFNYSSKFKIGSTHFYAKNMSITLSSDSVEAEESEFVSL